MNSLSAALKSLAETQEWEGTATELAAALNAYGLRPSIIVARLSTQLRKIEPHLFWECELSVKFTRTGERRAIRLAKRSLAHGCDDSARSCDAVMAANQPIAAKTEGELSG